ncbi:TraX family protein [Anaeromicropila herbilytica]|uniref:Fimbrial assembly protein fimC n=1 Tax=Anaeromicropila herbilytica TaxID=2785025 RepID=A0A7R7EMB4_9FIRM|nr:TraX family protein [Anaeromicropila herbilytica]BCN31437.1 fimbrial assembly protein fimC [Anaeromicropila herbilytica]
MTNVLGDSIIQSSHSNGSTEDKRGISGGTLKIIAILTMVVDHTAAVLYPAGIYADWVYALMRVIGRIAFPIFCFLLVEGFVHTRSRKKYCLRLALFAIISEVPFDLAFSGRIFDIYSQNVFFTLVIGFIALMLIEHFKDNEQMAVLCAVFSVLLAYILKTDYAAGGVILIILFYLFRGKFVKIGASLVTFAMVLIGYTEIYAVFALIPLSLYNGKKGVSLKYFFYIFYPAHLLILYYILHNVLQ